MFTSTSTLLLEVGFVCKDKKFTAILNVTTVIIIPFKAVKKQRNPHKINDFAGFLCLKEAFPPWLDCFGLVNT